MTTKAVVLLLASMSLFAADYRTGQAARAVLGQSSFTSRDTGIKVTSLLALRDRLYAADSNHHVLTFDLTKLGSLRDDRASRPANACSVCELTPVSQADQTVMPGGATVSVWRKTVAAVDTTNHRVLIWRDSASPRGNGQPDIILRRSGESSPIGPSTLVNPVSVGLDGKRLFVGDAALHRVLIWNSLPVTADQPADAVLGQPDFFSAASGETPGPDNIAFPSAIASDGDDVFIADIANARILVFSVSDALLAPGSAVNVASLQAAPLAPGTLINIKIDALIQANESAPIGSDQPLPKRLAGVEAIFDGEALPLLSVSPMEVEAQIPYDLGNRGGASLYLRIEHGNSVLVTSPIAVKLVPASPGLFALGGDEPRPGLLLHNAAAGSAEGNPPVTEENPARPGEIVTVWATGLGSIWDTYSALSAIAGRPLEGPPASVAVPVSAQINGEPAHVVSAVLPSGALGVYEIRIELPLDLPPSSQARLSVTQNGLTSNAIAFATRPSLP